jgi:hypothetical protein
MAQGTATTPVLISRLEDRRYGQVKLTQPIAKQFFHRFGSEHINFASCSVSDKNSTEPIK